LDNSACWIQMEGLLREIARFLRMYSNADVLLPYCDTNNLHLPNFLHYMWIDRFTQTRPLNGKKNLQAFLYGYGRGYKWRLHFPLLRSKVTNIEHWARKIWRVLLIWRLILDISLVNQIAHL
jgi:hypothetical protein